MIVNRFTTLYDCIKAKDADILGLFENSAVTALYDCFKAYRKNNVGDTNLIGILQKDKVNLNACLFESQQLIQNVIDNDNWQSAANRLREMLTPSKLLQLCEMLDAKNKTFRNAIIENDLYADFFADMPNCKLCIEQNDCYKETTGRNRKKENGKYSIYINSKDKRDSVEIAFPNKSSKLMYLLFLINPRIKISRDVIVQKINGLYSKVYPQPDEKNRWKSDCRFSTYYKFTIDEFSDAKAKANNAVKKALLKIDNTENPDWYTIENDTKDDKYDISIFSESLTNDFSDFNDYILKKDSL